MLKNYLKTSLRNLYRHKGYSIINTFGLTIGIAASILIFLWVTDELSFDRFHQNPDRLFKVLINNTHPDGRIETHGATPAKLKEVIQNEIPEVELAAQYSMDVELLVKYESHAFNEAGIYTDPELFKVLSYPIAIGNPSKPLPDIKSIAISKRLAEKLFHNENPIGKSLLVGQRYELTISSVFANIPGNSSLQFDFAIPFEIFLSENPWTQHWMSGGTRTLVLLKSPAFVEKANLKLADLIRKNCADCTTSSFLFPYAQSRLYSEFENGKNVGGRIQQVYLFSGVAVLILIMACINFMNLSTARSASRSREVGVRKSMGAQRSGLVAQFMTESVLLSFIALLLALVIVQLLLPFFNEVTAKTIQLDLTSPILLLGIFSITLICGLLSGSYPALLLSKFSPVKVLKGNTQSGLGGNFIRRSLVIIQFTASIILAVGSIAVYKQINFISQRDLGFEKDNIIVVDQNPGIFENYSAIKNDLHQLPAVADIAFGGNNIFTIPITTTDPVWQGKPDNSSITFKIYRCDAAFIPTMSIRMAAGRNFVDRFDSANYIVNRKAVEMMGLTLETAIGSKLEMWNGKGKIIGITEDFHNDNLKFGIEPMIFMYSSNIGSHYFIKLNAGQSIDQSLEQIGKVFKKHCPDFPFEYTFLDEVFNQEYESERVIAKLAFSFTLIAILISCLGLFGLASFTAERRTKELGIRKVMGASVGSIVAMLCKDFTNLVLFSLLAGLPIAWYLIEEYLSGYAFRTEITWSVYVITAGLMFIITFLSVGYQSVRASTANPVESLRTE